MRSLRMALAQVSLWAMGLCLLALVGLDFWQVVQRYVLGQSWPWAGDVGVILLLTLAWIGAGHLWLSRGHIAVEFLPLTSLWSRVLRVAFDLIAVIGGAILIPMTWDTMVAYSFIDLPTLPVSGAVKYAPVAAGLTFLTASAALVLFSRRP